MLAADDFRKWIEFLWKENSYPGCNAMEGKSRSAVTFFKFLLRAASKVKNTNVRNAIHVDFPPFIAVLDEATSLLEWTFSDADGREISLFRLLRRALKTMVRVGRNLMFILIDTNSKMGEFTSSLDPTLKYIKLIIQSLNTVISYLHITN